jgi:3-oxoadipate enol-lactonase
MKLYFMGWVCSEIGFLRVNNRWIWSVVMGGLEVIKYMPYITIADINLYYDTCGSGQTVVFLAGLSLNTSTWDRLTSFLEPDFRLIKVDCRGSGKSDIPRGPYSIERMADDVFQLICSLNLNRPILVGHSMGGFISLELALTHQKLLGGLVLLSTAPTGKPELLGTSYRARIAMDRKIGPMEEIVRQNMEVGLGRRMWEDHRELVEEEIRKRVANPPRGIGFMGQSAAARVFDVRTRLNEIQCPSVIVHGMEDEVVPVERALELSIGIAGSKIRRIEEVGHFPQLEDPKSLALAVQLASTLM